MAKKRLRVCLVLPVQSPYWSQRLKVLAASADLAVTVLLERATVSHRPGWEPTPIRNVTLEVLGSALMNFQRDHSDLGFRIHGTRGIPWRLPRSLWRHRPDVVVVCNASQLLMALSVHRFLGFKLALIVEDTPHATRGLPWWLHRVRACVYQQADHYFAFSHDAVDYLRSIKIVDRLSRSSWSLDMESFGALNKFVNARQARMIEISFVGQFIPMKGVEELLRAWEQLPQETVERARLSMVGTGPLREEMMAYSLARGLKNVTFPGHLSAQGIINQLSKTDLFVLPTLQDLFSLAVLEAMASNCAVITTPFNGARELIDEGRNGWIVDPTEPQALRLVLAKALSPETDLCVMGKAARDRVVGMDNRRVMKEFEQAMLDVARYKQVN